VAEPPPLVDGPKRQGELAEFNRGEALLSGDLVYVVGAVQLGMRAVEVAVLGTLLVKVGPRLLLENRQPHQPLAAAEKPQAREAPALRDLVKAQLVAALAERGFGDEHGEALPGAAAKAEAPCHGCHAAVHRHREVA
jgi:hypothetical protein